MWVLGQMPGGGGQPPRWPPESGSPLPGAGRSERTGLPAAWALPARLWPQTGWCCLIALAALPAWLGPGLSSTAPAPPRRAPRQRAPRPALGGRSSASSPAPRHPHVRARVWAWLLGPFLCPPPASAPSAPALPVPQPRTLHVPQPRTLHARVSVSLVSVPGPEPAVRCDLVGLEVSAPACLCPWGAAVHRGAPGPRGGSAPQAAALAS